MENWKKEIEDLPGFQAFEGENHRICADFFYKWDDIDGAAATFWFAIPFNFIERYPEDTYNKFMELVSPANHFWFDFYNNVSSMLAKMIEFYKSND